MKKMVPLGFALLFVTLSIADPADAFFTRDQFLFNATGSHSEPTSQSLIVPSPPPGPTQGLTTVTTTTTPVISGGGVTSLQQPTG